MYSIEIVDLCFGYSPDRLVLDRLNLKLSRNKYICILGHNGSGKSTLSKLIMGLIRAQSGVIRIADIELNDENYKKILHKIGLVFQNPDNQFIGLTAEDDIAFGLENRNVPRVLCRKIIDEVSRHLDIEPLLHINSFLLSGGQKQKVAIASILALDPEIIIFDESTSMLDTKSKEDILGTMQDLVRNQNKTVISITHDMEELLLADEVVLFKSGKVLAHTTPKELLKDLELIRSSNLDLPFIHSLATDLRNRGLDVPFFESEEELLDILAKM